jgi:hypothetical protein
MSAAGCGVQLSNGGAGWVADPTAVPARLIDTTGRTLSDEVENAVFLFMWKGDFKSTERGWSCLTPTIVSSEAAACGAAAEPIAQRPVMPRSGRSGAAS